MVLRTRAALSMMLLAFFVFAACGEDGGDGGPQPTEEPTATAPRLTEPADRTPGALTPASEGGAAPVFWRTIDAFASVRAGEAYKVLFRVTNGYAEPTLRIVAACTSCASPSQRQELEFVAERAQPLGEEAPGSYYPVNIELPFAGSWQLTVVAGEDEVTIPVTVQPAQPASAG